MRDAMEKRSIRVTRSSIYSWWGPAWDVHCYIWQFIESDSEKRGVYDVYTVVGAGSATAAIFGLLLPGSIHWHLRNVALGSVLGAAFCFPIGWLQLKLVEKANEGRLAAYPKLDGSKEAKSGVGAAIERLEEQLSK